MIERDQTICKLIRGFNISGTIRCGIMIRDYHTMTPLAITLFLTFQHDGRGYICTDLSWIAHIDGISKGKGSGSEIFGTSGQ